MRPEYANVGICFFFFFSNRSNKGKNGQNGTEQPSNGGITTANIGVNVLNTEEEEENEGLALLIPNIQETARIVKISTDRLQQASGTII